MLSQNTHSEKEQLEADRVLAANMLLQLQSRGNPPPSSQRTDNPLARNGKEKSHKRKKHSQDKELRASKKQRTGSAFHDSDAKSSRDDRRQSSQHGIIEALKIPSE